MAIDDSTRRTVLKLLEAGLATQSETARLARVDRRLVAYWARSAGIDAPKNRRNRLAQMWAYFKR